MKWVALCCFLWMVLMPARTAGHGICQDGSPPIFDIEALCAGSTEVGPPVCNGETYLSYVESGEKAKKKRSDLFRKTGTGCQLQEADFAGQTFRKKYFWKANLVEANLVGAVFERFSFKDAQLQEATFTDGNFDEANLRRANLSGARFQNVDFYKTNLTKAKLFGADFRGAGYLHDANLRGAVYDAHSQFPADFDPQAAGMQQK